MRTWLVIIALLYMGSIGTVEAADIIEFDCTSNNDRPTTSLAYGYSSYDSSINTETYFIDVANKEGAFIIEYCVYPTPGFAGTDDDITVLYDSWHVDHIQNKDYFGFDSRNEPKMPLNGVTGIQVGRARYNSQPSSEVILLHISDPVECAGQSSCWRRASTSPITPTPTPTETVTPIPTETVTPTPTETVTPTPTPIGDILAPSQPLCPVAIATGPTTIYLSWWESIDNIGVVGYKIYRGTSPEILYYFTTVTGTSYTDTGLTTGTTYYYSIVAIDAAGNPSLPSDEIFATPRDIEAPIVTVPSNIVEEATSPNGAVVTFSASASDDIDGSITPVCTPSSGSTFPLGLTTVTCTATDSAGNIGSAIFTITVRDTTSPTVPSGLIATAVSMSRIDLSWTASTDAVGIIRYWIYRSLDNINFVAIASTTGTSFSNTGLSRDTTYYYYIIALDSAGNPSGQSNTASAKTFPYIPPTPGPTGTPGPGPTDTPGPEPSPSPEPSPGPVDIPPTIIIPSNMIIEATSPNGAVATYSASASDPEDGDLTGSVICVPASGYTFPIGFTTVQCAVTDSAGNTVSGIFSIRVVDTTPPTAPTGLTATAISSTRIDLSWTASSDIVGVMNYRIYQSLDNINWAPIGTSVGTLFYNTGLIPNTTYFYYVIALDNAGNPSNPSNIASAGTLPQPPSPPPGPSPSPTVTEPSPTATVNPCAPPESGNTPQGENVEVATSSDIGVTFDAVLQCGDTTAIAYYDNVWTPLPSSYTEILFYDIDTTATYDNYVTIEVIYSDIPSGINENSLRLFHYENGNWVDVTTALDTTANIITGRVTSLSPFGIGGINSGSGGSGGSGNSTTVMRGYSSNIVGFLLLGLCLVIISILTMRREGKI